jgi:hypothetical protein
MSLQPAIPINGNYNKLTMFMSTPTKRFSEVHWNISQAVANDVSLTTNAAALATLRAACLPTGCNLYKWTLSQENVWRDAYQPTLGVPYTIYGTEPENLGNDCLNVFLQGTVQYRRVMYFGAVPDSSVTNDGFVQPAGNAWFAAFKAYMIGLAGTQLGPNAPSNPVVNSQWGFLPIMQGAGAPPIVPIAAEIFTAGATTFTVATTANHGCNPGDVVRISKVQGANTAYPINQLWLVQAAPTVLTLTLGGFAPQATIDNPCIPLTGFLQKRIRVFQAYSNWLVEAVGSRNRGVRENSVLGRRKRKRTIGY